jgi:hypothetical protein
MTKEQFEMAKLTTLWGNKRHSNLKRLNDCYGHAIFKDIGSWLG